MLKASVVGVTILHVHSESFPSTQSCEMLENMNLKKLQNWKANKKNPKYIRFSKFLGLNLCRRLGGKGEKKGGKERCSLTLGVF